MQGMIAEWRHGHERWISLAPPLLRGLRPCVCYEHGYDATGTPLHSLPRTELGMHSWLSSVRLKQIFRSIE